MSRFCALILPALFVAMLFSGCESIEETTVEKILLNSETELMAFYNLPPDTSIAFEDADSLYNYMKEILEHYKAEPEECSSRTYFEEGGRAVTYYYTHDTLNHITYGEWEQIAPDSVKMTLRAVLASFQEEIVVADGNFQVERIEKGTFSFTSGFNRAEAQLVLLPLLTNPNGAALPSYTGVFEQDLEHVRTQFIVKRIDELE